ncbi:hypothetical protein R0135_07595 [Congregibacter variabilis]|uniref:Tryptophan synthase subunit beta like protein n=1 Tax=Congregibacter variabilis TaxID=3081200 RepID=A0ABZ0I684_9GAMM|nr:hypothetical protein R0135_07595 [Congregibacter sp. IMCC43200]
MSVNRWSVTMFYVQRDAKGEICAVSENAQPGFDQELPPGDPELRRFMESVVADGELARTDLEFVRVLEDVLDLLMDKNILLFTELPEKAQAKILERQALRRGDNPLDLIDDDQRI